MLDPRWVADHPEWRVVHDCDRCGYAPDDNLLEWFFLDVGDLDLDLHLWCVENCRDRFFSHSEPMSGMDACFAFKDQRDAALFKLFFAERLIAQE